jgi:tripartite-type tricarboxylate transporter receptor subunit TctC
MRSFRQGEARMMKSRCLIAIAAFPTVVFLPPLVLAQTYPAKTVRVIVPFPPAGSNDIVGRIAAQKLSELLGQQFVIDNRGGAGGNIGAELVANSAPDGYTLMVHSASHIANAHLHKKLPYDVLKSFTGVTTIARQVGILIVHPALPAKSVKDFIRIAKARPGEIVYGSASNGSYAHLAMALFGAMAGVSMVHVPYKGGGPAGTALIAGETQAMLNTIGTHLPHIRAGRVRALGVASEKRIAQFPDVPAIAETVPGFELTAWVGLFVPAGTPKAIVDTLNAALARALADPAVAAKLTEQMLDPMVMSPDQFAARLKSDYEKYGKVVRLSNAQID